MKTILFLITALVLVPGLSIAQQSPCDSEVAHQFDFWIGKWNVYKYGTDTLAGYNIITPIAGGCALLENWTSAVSGFTGNSINKYNFRKKKWKQMWVDNSGSTLEIEGVYSGNKMILTDAAGENTAGPNKITWTKNDDGTVRQLWEVTTDNGKTWSVAFDGLYVRDK